MAQKINFGDGEIKIPQLNINKIGDMESFILNQSFIFRKTFSALTEMKKKAIESNWLFLPVGGYMINRRWKKRNLQKMNFEKSTTHLNL